MYHNPFIKRVDGQRHFDWPGSRSARLTPDQEQAITEAVSQFYLAAGGRSKLVAYDLYRRRCAQTRTPHVTLRTFYRHLRGHDERQARPGRPYFLAVALIDETVVNFLVCGGTSS